MIRRSRETTTHFAWCLRDVPDEPFTFWLHEYKEQRDWRQGYADSVHNHRYHFCTTILRGGYLHERYAATINPSTELIGSAELVTSDPVPGRRVRVPARLGLPPDPPRRGRHHDVPREVPRGDAVEPVLRPRRPTRATGTYRSRPGWNAWPAACEPP